jgi:hypothetical protein
LERLTASVNTDGGKMACHGPNKRKPKFQASKAATSLMADTRRKFRGGPELIAAT